MSYENYPSFTDLGSSFYHTDKYPLPAPAPVGCSHGRAQKNFAGPLFTCPSCGRSNIHLSELVNA